jgi:hypothetical protein
MAEQDFEFTIAVTPKPVAGVSLLPVPENLAKHLTTLVPKVLKDADHELTITAASKADAAKLAAHAKRWGSQQTPELYINKIHNRRDMSDNIARLNVRLMSDVPVENRPGRK